MAAKTGTWLLEITFCSYSRNDRTFTQTFDLQAKDTDDARREANETYRRYSFHAEEKAEQDVSHYVPIRAHLFYKERVYLFEERI